MSKETNYIGNISTIVKIIGLTIAGWIISLLASKGLNLNIDAATLGEVIGAFIGLGVGYVDAKYPNTLKFFRNEDEICDVDPASEYETPEAGEEDENTENI